MSEKISAGHIDQEVTGLPASQTRKPFAEPKLTFIEPKLTKHGDATKITGNNGFFSIFKP
ncbi:MAG: hypothetical protein ACUBOA_13125 [Candidatus Loosdrechtia sp.]|uniref:hypothetical protein n=1 Tax=Candidatus Loosdrechtia sp. TaxID=3101272 RepID=UPI003A6539EF|nr:MAG: hypothetical protein QY305_11275 [Candidatus Jettenia sp. AMX2]